MAVAHWLRRCATNQKVVGSIPPGVIEIFHWHKILPIAIWPWGRLSLEQKWVRGVFPGGKGCRCVRLTTLPPSCAVVMKPGNLNFLEPSGPLQARNGADFPFTTFYFMYFSQKYIIQAKCFITLDMVLLKITYYEFWVSIYCSAPRFDVFVSTS